jgi:hypothetical protein
MFNKALTTAEMIELRSLIKPVAPTFDNNQPVFHFPFESHLSDVGIVTRLHV